MRSESQDRGSYGREEGGRAREEAKGGWGSCRARNVLLLIAFVRIHDTLHLCFGYFSICVLYFDKNKVLEKNLLLSNIK